MNFEDYKRYLKNFLLIVTEKDVTFLRQLCTLIEKYLESRGKALAFPFLMFSKD